MSSKASHQELSLEPRVKRARDQHITTCGERLTPEYTASVAEHGRTDLGLHPVHAIFTIVLHLLATTATNSS